MRFRRLNDAQLIELPAVQLLAYIKGARAAGENGAALEASRILAFAHADRIEAFVRNKLGSKGALVAEEVAAQAVAAAIDSAHTITGQTEAEVRAFFFQIARYKIIDFHRSARGDFRHVPDEWVDEEGERRRIELGVEGDPTDAVDLASVFNQAYAELDGNPVHREVVKAAYFTKLSRAEIAEEINRHFSDQLNDPMTEDNVNQIKSRFARRLRELLEED